MTIREIFAAERPIDREIEKVIRIDADSEMQLASEVAEYEVTSNVETNFEKFLEAFGDGTELGHETEMGVWVSGFYGSGKSSFTKYLAVALDSQREVQGHLFVDLLKDRFPSMTVRALLGKVSAKGVAVVTLDLGEQMQVAKHNEPVSSVLYWRILKWAGYSEVKEVAHLELEWEQRGELDKLAKAVQEECGLEWKDIHNDPLICKPLVSRVLHRLQPERYSTPDTFAHLSFELNITVQDQAKRAVDIVRKRTGRKLVLFVIDEAGQYVAPSAERILDLDGLCRSLKGYGQGKVWVIATGQQTLTEIFARAALNSPELFKLRDRFPISIEFSPNDIKEITYRRLLSKSATGEAKLKELFQSNGDSARTFTRLEGAAQFDSSLDQDRFVRFYPFLPQHFDILMALTRSLARSTGGIGLRSAIRVIQDVLVDKSRAAGGAVLLADEEVGLVATVDRFYDTLREDLRKSIAFAVEGVEKVEQFFAGDELKIRLAKAIAALQAVEGLPRTPENLAALLYRKLGDPSSLDAVRVALKDLEESKDCNLIDDPSTDGYQFVSSAVRDFKRKRNEYVPDLSELNDVRKRIWQGEAGTPLFTVQPQAKLGSFKQVASKVRVGNIQVHSGSPMELVIEFVAPDAYDSRRTSLLNETRDRPELQNSVVWLAPLEPNTEELSIEIARSLRAASVRQDNPEQELLQFARNEQRRAERLRDELAKSYEQALLRGDLVFRATPIPAKEAGDSVLNAAQRLLTDAAKKVFPKYSLADIKTEGDLASKYLRVEVLRNITSVQDPLKTVVHTGGNASVDLGVAVLAETLTEFKKRAKDTNRLTGGQIFEVFQKEPYGWGNDTIRYIFAALLTAGSIKAFGTADADPIVTRGPRANEVFKGNDSFKRSGFALRESSERPAADVLLRAAENLEKMIGDVGQISPLEDVLARHVQEYVPDIADALAPLSEQLRLLELPGVERAKTVQDSLGAVQRGDGTNAAFVLGDPSTTLPDDLRWAQKVQKCLAEGGEADIRAAKTLHAELEDLETLSASLPIRESSSNRIQTVEEVIASEQFADRLADLRSAVQAIRLAMVQEYDSARERVAAAYATALREIEGLPGWSTLAPADQEDLGAKLSVLLAEKAGENPAPNLRQALLAELKLATIRESVVNDVVRLQPKPVEPEPTTTTPGSGPEPKAPVTVKIRTATRQLRNAQDVESLLNDLRDQVNAELSKHGIIEIQFEPEGQA